MEKLALQGGLVRLSSIRGGSLELQKKKVNNAAYVHLGLGGHWVSLRAPPVPDASRNPTTAVLPRDSLEPLRSSSLDPLKSPTSSTRRTTPCSSPYGFKSPSPSSSTSGEANTLISPTVALTTTLPPNLSPPIPLCMTALAMTSNSLSSSTDKTYIPPSLPPSSSSLLPLSEPVSLPLLASPLLAASSSPAHLVLALLPSPKLCCLDSLATATTIPSLATAAPAASLVATAAAPSSAAAADTLSSATTSAALDCSANKTEFSDVINTSLPSSLLTSALSPVPPLYSATTLTENEPLAQSTHTSILPVTPVPLSATLPVTATSSLPCCQLPSPAGSPSTTAPSPALLPASAPALLPFSASLLLSDSSAAQPTFSSTCPITQANLDDLNIPMNVCLAPDLSQAALEQYRKIDGYLQLSGVIVTDEMKIKKKKKKKKKNLIQSPLSSELPPSVSPAFSTAAVGALSVMDEETIAYLKRKNDPRYRPIEDSEYIEFDAW
ncbi:hypothetical protein PCANC_10555 [Puccinia coronata f. sp. avenae]|uniref:Uncharacterized protein n=1 Tax=Puccinia coronata f. sp. avenae TaxID=200324 RepID=A0A2N5VZ76_9BASI|nr:hypothetical protein PCANC_10555 [Puccinia coronata f. sp. avenae]